MTISNLFLSATVFVLFFVMLGNEQGTYLEHAQTPLYTIIFTEIALILANRIFKNPLLDILNLVFIVFFLLRVPFLYGDDLVSDIYFRSVNIDKVNYALYVLNFQLIALSLCVIFIKPVRIYGSKAAVPNDIWHRVLRFTSLILFFNVLFFAFIYKIGEDNLPNLFAILYSLFNYASILILLVPLLLLADKNTAVKYRIYLYLQLAICALIVMYAGSKSGLFQIIAMYLVSVLAIYGSSYKITLRASILGLFLLTGALALYLLGEIFNRAQRAQVEFTDWYHLVTLSLNNLSASLNRVSYRLGYFDFYIDKLTQEVYAHSFQLEYYAKAFINAVTPGFDVFDNASLVSRAVFADYFGKNTGANSEVVTVFAEAHHLFGYFSFLAYLFVLSVIFLIRKYKINFNTNYAETIFSIFLCLMFFRYMLGMGIDFWLFGEVIYPLIFIALSFKFMGLSKIKIAN